MEEYRYSSNLAVYMQQFMDEKYARGYEQKITISNGLKPLTMATEQERQYTRKLLLFVSFFAI